MVRNLEGAVEVEGILDSELRIRPLRGEERSLEGEIPHQIFEVEADANSLNLGVSIEAHGKSSRAGGLRTRTKRGNQARNRAGGDKFVVEVHLISDSSHQQHLKNNKELIAYLAVMTNGVNLRYTDMAAPKVSFMLVGVTRSKDDSFETQSEGLLDAGETLQGLKKYIKAGNVPGEPDVLYLVTELPLGARKDGKLVNSLGGLAFLGTVCTEARSGRKCRHCS